MTPRSPGRHTRRALANGKLSRDQLATVVATLSPEQLHAALRTLIERDPALAKAVIDAAIAEYPIQPPPPPRMIP